MQRAVIVIVIFVFLATVEAASSGGCDNAVFVPGPYVGQSLFGDTTNALPYFNRCNLYSFSGSNFFQIAPDPDLVLRISTCSRASSFDTALALFRGDSCDSLECVTVNDDTPCIVSSGASMIEFTPTGGTYWVMVTGYSNSEGQFQVTFDQATTTANTCQTSTAVYGPFVTPVTILGLLGDNTTNAQQPCELESNALGNWYVIYPTPGAEVTVKTCSEYAEFDTQLAVLSGSDCGDTTCVAYNDDNCSTHYRQLSTVTFRASGARFFFVYVTNYGSATGYYYLTISEEIAHASGDNCATAYEIPSPGVYDGFSNAGSDLIIESACNSATVNCPATWFAISPPAGCTVTVTTCSEATDFDTTITSFSSCKLASCFAHNDDSSLCEVNYRSSMLSVYSAQPRIYFAVRGYRCRTGNFSFTVDY